MRWLGLPLSTDEKRLQDEQRPAHLDDRNLHFSLTFPESGVQSSPSANVSKQKRRNPFRPTTSFHEPIWLEALRTLSQPPILAVETSSVDNYRPSVDA